MPNKTRRVVFVVSHFRNKQEKPKRELDQAILRRFRRDFAAFTISVPEMMNDVAKKPIMSFRPLAFLCNFFSTLEFVTLSRREAEMAQVVATRSMQGSMLSPNGVSVSTRSEKLLKPASFAVKVLENEVKRSGRVSVRSRRVVDTIVRFARLETEVIPVSPEDVPIVCGLIF